MLILMVAAAFAQAQQEPASPATANAMSIPAELTKTVRAENAQRGAPVEFRTLEAVLLPNGLVIPRNTKLTGRIVGAAPLQGDKPSWLVLLVERAAWKDQTVSLHAYIASQISVSDVDRKGSGATGGPPGSTNPRRLARESGRVAALNDIDISSNTKLPQDASSSEHPAFGAGSEQIKGLRIVRDKDGVAYLFSSQSNVKLPSGGMFMLQNQPLTESRKPTTEAPGQAPSSPPQ